MAAIGILGGMGPQASNKLYELLIKKTASHIVSADNDDYPEIVLLSIPVPDFISNKKKINEAKRMLVQRTKLLDKAGCTIIGIACNTVHLLLPDLQAVTSVPILSIPKLVNVRINANDFRRVGLFATPTTLQSSLYDDAIDTAVIVRPSAQVAELAKHYIYKQLSGGLTQADRKNFRKDVAVFMQENSLDAVILGCTELPLVYGESKDMRILDTLDVLSDALLYGKFNCLNEG